MTPELKSLNRKAKREFYLKRKSERWKTLRRKFQILKRRTVRKFYSKFVSEMKSTNLSKWCQLAKRLGTDDHKNDDLKVECLNDVPLNEAAEEIAKHFSHISQEYLPLDLKQLPS